MREGVILDAFIPELLDVLVCQVLWILEFDHALDVSDEHES